MSLNQIVKQPLKRKQESCPDLRLLPSGESKPLSKFNLLSVLKTRPSITRQRTLCTIAALGSKVENGHITINNIAYALVSSETRDWLSGPLVSIGANIASREFLICDPTTGPLQEWIDKFTQQDFFNFSIKTTLKAVVIYIKKHIIFNEQEVLNYLHTMQTNDKNQKYEGTPIIDIYSFIEQKTGVCRHASLLTAFLIAGLQSKEILPGIGEIIHVRYSTNHNAHAKIHFKIDGTTWVIDPTNSRESVYIDKMHLRLSVSSTESDSDSDQNIHAKKRIREDATPLTPTQPYPSPSPALG